MCINTLQLRNLNSTRANLIVSVWDNPRIYEYRSNRSTTSHHHRIHLIEGLLRRLLLLLLEEDRRRPFGRGQVEILGESEAEVAKLSLANHAAARARVDRSLVEAYHETVSASREEVFGHFVRERQC